MAFLVFVLAVEENAVSLVVVLVTDKPKLNLAANLFHFQKKEKNLFFVPEIPNWIVVNNNSAVLLFSCDGSKTEEAILNSYDLHGQARSDAQNLFQESLARGILHEEPFLLPSTESVELTKISPTNNNALASVYLKLTDECNLRCKYCYASSGNKSEVLSLSTLRRIAKDVSNISNHVDFVLSGGEPLLNPHALDFAEEIVANGNGAQLLTNGALIDNKKIAKRIASAFNLIKISIDGSTEEIHSMSRGRRNLDKVINSIELLETYGANVKIAMTVTKNNMFDIENMTKLYGSKLNFQPLFKAGRGENKFDIGLTGKEYYDAMNNIENVAPMGNIAHSLERIRGRGVKKCALADREISISETGDVYPCQLLHADELIAGNIYKQSLHDIYFNSDILKQMRLVNVNSIDECSKCPIKLVCAGGCRARDYHESGSIDSVGEFCEYEKQAIINGLLDYSQFGD